MSFDLLKLSPAPWSARKARKAWRIKSGDTFVMEHGCYGVRTDADAEFIALARNAFDVMIRRGWGVEVIGNMWTPVRQGPGGLRQFWQEPQAELGINCDVRGWSDPFTALVEAEKWYVANVEKA